jgi:hypothetical protein
MRREGYRGYLNSWMLNLEDRIEFPVNVRLEAGWDVFVDVLDI